MVKAHPFYPILKLAFSAKCQRHQSLSWFAKMSSFLYGGPCSTYIWPTVCSQPTTAEITPWLTWRASETRRRVSWVPLIPRHQELPFRRCQRLTVTVYTTGGLSHDGHGLNPSTGRSRHPGDASLQGNLPGPWCGCKNKQLPRDARVALTPKSQKFSWLAFSWLLVIP